MRGKSLPVVLRTLLLLAGCLATLVAAAQQPTGPSSNDEVLSAVRDLQQQVRDLRAAVDQLRSESAQYRDETVELRHQLEDAHAQPQSSAETATAQAGSATSSSTATRLASLQDSFDLLTQKVNDQYQTKVSSGSKYPVRLSGLVLMNAFSNRGSTDNQDIPSWAVPAQSFSSAGNFGATLRQSEIGLEVFGPHLAGAKTSGSVQFDFSGGFPDTSNGVNYGLVRLRTAEVRFDWETTSIIAGQDAAFVSPLSPASFASLAIPAFSYAGNLWGWIPQVRVERHFAVDDQSSFLLQGGVFDNLTGEPPYVQYYRIPQAGEKSSQPAYGSRIAYTYTVFGQPLTIGAAGYYSRQNWGFNRHVDGWAGMTDFQFPFSSRFGLSGEFYRGKSVGGLGGGIDNSVVYNGNPLAATTEVYGVNSEGGWGQLKFRATSKLEFNAGFGIDNPFASDLRDNSPFEAYGTTLVRNRGSLVNFIYRPRSNLLLSSEYRHLRTFQLDNTSEGADQINMIVGILF